MATQTAAARLIAARRAARAGYRPVSRPGFILPLLCRAARRYALVAHRQVRLVGNVAYVGTLPVMHTRYTEDGLQLVVDVWPEDL